MAYNSATRTFTVGTDDELNAAIANLDAIGKKGNNNGLDFGDYTIKIARNITLDGTSGGTYAAITADGASGDPLTVNTAYTPTFLPWPLPTEVPSRAVQIPASNQLYAINLNEGVSVSIDGSDGAGGSYVLDGNGANASGAQAYNGFLVYNGNVYISNLSITNAVATGGSSSNGGGGAGLGGGLFVAGPNSAGNLQFPSVPTAGGSVRLTNVSFAHNGAQGGSSGLKAHATGGGGLNGGSAIYPGARYFEGYDPFGISTIGGGGVGFGASSGAFVPGAEGGSIGGPGLIIGAASGGGGQYGGAFGGGGAGPGGGSFGFGGGGGAGQYYMDGVSGGFGGGGSYGTSVYGGGSSAFGGGGGGAGRYLGGAGGFGGGRGRGSFEPGSGQGGGGLGAGADIFVQEGGSLTIAGTSSLGAGTVTGGSAGVNGSAGAGLGSGIFLQGNQSINLAPGTGETLTVAGVVADQTGSTAQLIAGGQTTKIGAGSLNIGEGTVVLAPVTSPDGSDPGGAATANTYTGGTSLNTNANLTLVSQGAAGSGAITFTPLSGTAAARLTLQVTAQPNGVTFANTIANFGVGSQLDLAGLTGATASYNSSNNLLTVNGTSGGSSVTQSYQINLADPTQSNSFRTQSDGNGGTLVTLCFTTGTRLRTTRGEVAVEDLRVGDRVVTASGALRPVTWIGHRPLVGAGRALPASQQPVRVRAGAFGSDLPTRDLRLSPGHPVLVGADAAGMGGHLVPIMCLINGTSIAREPATSVTYWHVELDAHDVLLAEGLPAESYLDWGDRPFFTEASDHALHNPDFVVPGLAARCRPVAVDGPVVEAERARLSGVFAASLGEACAWNEAERFDWIAA